MHHYLNRNIANFYRLLEENQTADQNVDVIYVSAEITYEIALCHPLLQHIYFIVNNASFLLFFTTSIGAYVGGNTDHQEILILPRKYWPAPKINIWSVFPRKYQYFLYYRKYWPRLSDFCTIFIRFIMQPFQKNYSHGSITSQLCISCIEIF